MSSSVYKPYLQLSDFLPDCHSILSEYVCPLCRGILNEPVLEPCGTSIYCRECLLQFFEENGSCPEGKKCSVEKIIQMDFVARLVKKQDCYCKHRDFGCPWKGKVADLEEHLTRNCENKPVQCPFDGCKVELTKNSLSLHSAYCEFRSENCADCLMKVTLNQKEQHEATCPNKKVLCFFECGDEVERGKMEEHKLTCLNSPVECKYKLLGCNFSSSKAHLEAHMRTANEEHGSLIFNEVIGIKTMFSNFMDRMTRMETLTDENTDKLQQFVNLNIKSTTCQNSKATSEKKSEIVNQVEAKTPSDFTKKKRKRETEKDLIDLASESENRDDFEVSVGEFDNISPLKSKISPKKNSYMNHNRSFKEEITFDTMEISRGISVNVNTATCCSNVPKMDHRFAFTNNILDKSNYEWKVKINSLNGKWMGIGVCIKELIVSNKFRFVANKLNFMHGTFMISTNGYSWNTNNDSENNKVMEGFPNIREGDEIQFRYFYDDEKLEIIIGDFRAELTDIACPQSNYLTPCVVFLNPGDKVTFSKMRIF